VPPVGATSCANAWSTNVAAAVRLTALLCQVPRPAYHASPGLLLIPPRRRHIPITANPGDGLETLDSQRLESIMRNLRRQECPTAPVSIVQAVCDEQVVCATVCLSLVRFVSRSLHIATRIQKELRRSIS